MAEYNISISDNSEFTDNNSINCEDATLTVKDGNNLTLSDFHCSGICTFDIHDSSALTISNGSINQIKGSISDTSKSLCNAICNTIGINVSDDSVFTTP